MNKRRNYIRVKPKEEIRCHQLKDLGDKVKDSYDRQMTANYPLTEEIAKKVTSTYQGKKW